MLEFLATEMGFTIFSIEANMPEAYKLNDFVLKGEGDPATLIKGMYFWTWDTEEVLDMVRWMREFNKSGKGRVEFTGFDMQGPNTALGTVKDFVAKTDPEYAVSLNRAGDLALTPPKVAPGVCTFSGGGSGVMAPVGGI
jgi:erythromycin esterase